MEAISKFEKLNNQNWSSWKFRMEMLLTREGLFHVVEEPKPEPVSAKWSQDDKRARATMGLCIEENQYSLVKAAPSASDFWECLRRYHEKCSVTSRVSLLKKLCNLNLREGGDLESHLFEVEELFDKLQSAGQDLEDSLKIAMILRSLPDSYSGLVTALEGRPDGDLTVQLVKSKLLDEYERRKERSGGFSGEAKALKSGANPRRAGGSKPEVECFQCRKKGHFKRNCPDLRKKINKSEPSKAKVAVERNASAVLFMAGRKIPNCCVIDSGASSHMWNVREVFTSLNEESAQEIILADGSVVKSAGCGTVEVTGVDGCGGTVTITLEDVLYVPSLTTSLLSVSKLASKNFEVFFNRNDCDICDQSGKVVVKGIRSGSLYHLKLIETVQKCESKQHNELCQHQWHRRFGHRDPTSVDRIAKEKMAAGMKVKDCGIRMVCETCVEGKLSRTPIPKSAERKSTKVLDLVHTDLCGPMQTSTPSGNRYLMTVIDDYSRYTVVYLLARKSDATDKIIEYVRYVETLFDRKPRIVRSDGGGEYDNKRLQAFFAEEGMKAQFTTAYTPQQNGVAERKNRYLQEMATTMLLDANLDKKYWGEAVITANYLQNRLLSRAIDSTPFEKWFGRKPNVGHLRVFGSKAWVHIPDVKRGKFDSKAQKLTFIGYSGQHKGYKFVDLETEKVTISRDAKFLEFGCPKEQNPDTPQIETETLVPLTGSDCDQTQIPTGESERYAELDDSDGDQSEEEQFFEFSPDSASEDPLSVKLEPDEIVEEVPGSRNSRNRKLPGYLSDFVVGVASQAVVEPVSFTEATKCPERDAWKIAMEDELKSHKDNNTWELVDLPPGKKVVGSRWVYKAKTNESGEVARYKARLVAQGHTQRYGVDFDEVFAPVIRHATLRTLLAVASRDKLVLKHLDVRTAYLYGEINEEIYMRQPPGYAVRGQEEKVCRLRRSIYGLRQSARCWNKKLSNVLAKMEFKPSSTDPCLFTAVRNSRKVYLIVYVDDILVGCASEEEIAQVYEELITHFDIKCLGEAKYFLGLEVAKDSEGIFSLGVQSYIERLVVAFGMKDAKVARTPMDQGFYKDTTDSKKFKDITLYRSLVGALMYVAVCARPDIAASAAALGRKFSGPTEKDWTAAKRVVRYLKGTAGWRLKLGGVNDGSLEAFSDADWAGDPDSRKSTTGFVVYFAGAAVSWASRRQSCVSLSSMEAEYVALAETCQEVLWMQRLLEDLGEQRAGPTTVHEDNQGCLAFVQSERTSRRSKHINTKECFIRDLCERGVVKLQYCPTDEMRADIFTKPLGKVKHQKFAELIGLRSNEGAHVEEE